MLPRIALHALATPSQDICVPSCRSLGQMREDLVSKDDLEAFKEVTAQMPHPFPFTGMFASAL